MASPEPPRKGWHPAVRATLLVVLSAVAMAPVSFILGMLLTPLLWKLEGPVGVELAGHSGPAGWVLWTLWGFVTAALAFALLVRGRPTS